MALMGGRRRWALAARWPNAIADSSSQGARKTIPTSAGISVKTMETLDWRLRTVTGWAHAPQIPSATNSHRTGRSPPAGLRPANSVKYRSAVPAARTAAGARARNNPACQARPSDATWLLAGLSNYPAPKTGVNSPRFSAGAIQTVEVPTSQCDPASAKLVGGPRNRRST